MQRTPVRSILSFRLYNDGGRAAAHTTVAWNMMRRQEQFRSALASRDIIGQAKGILLERFDINAVAAFDLLRRVSQESNVTLVDVAERLVNLEHPSP